MRQPWTWVVAALAAAGIALWLWTGMGGGKGDATRGDGVESPAPAPEADPAAPEPAPATPSLRAAEGPAREARAPAPAPRAPLAEGWTRIRVTGTVVDANRKPAAGIAVELHEDAGALAAGTTAADGAFELSIDVAPGDKARVAGLVARGGGRIAWRYVFLRWDRFAVRGPGAPDTGTRDLGEIPLVASGTLQVLVTADGAPHPGAEVRAIQDPYPMSPTLARATTDGTGRVRLDLPEGTWRVIATAAGRGRVAAPATVGDGAGDTVRLDLPVERTVEVLVVDAANDAPVPGATVLVSETIKTSMGYTRRPYGFALDVPPTDAAGRTRLTGMAPTDVLSVGANAPGFAVSGGFSRSEVAVRPGDAQVKVPIQRVRTIAWPVVAGERPVPADGTAIRLAPEPGAGFLLVPTEGRMEGGRIVVEGLNPGYASALAYAPDGSVARLWADGKTGEGRETSFRAARRIDVALTYPDGAPAAGWYARAMNQGNNAMGPSVLTDAAGKAVLDGFHGQLVEVYVAVDASPYGGRAVGSVDLEKGSGKVEAVVSRMLEGVARVRGGTMPAEAVVTVEGATMGKQQADEAAGGLRFRWWPFQPGATAVAWLRAPGFQAARGDVPVLAAGEVADVEFDLRPAAVVVIRVLAPPDAQTHVQLQRWNEQAGEWGATEYSTQSFGPGGRTLTLDARGVGRVDTLAPGRYRAFEPRSKAASAPADLVAGGTPVELTLDLRGGGEVRGRVIVPEGFSAREVVVARDGGPANPSPWDVGGGSGAVGEDGSFTVRVPGGETTTLRPSHPLLVPAKEEGSVSVTGPREGVVLRMVPGPTATVHFDRVPKGYRFEPGRRREKVLLYRGEPRGAPAATVQALLEDATARFGGFEPGTYTVWLDVAPFAPVVLRDVALGAGETKLGTAHVSDGSGVRVTVLVKDGQAIPRLSASATRQDEAAYVRFGEFRTGEFRLTGLGPGTFRVLVHATMGAARGLDEVVVVDGVGDASLTLDLR